MLWPREAGRFITSKAKDVKIIHKGIMACAKSIADAVHENKLNIEAFKQSEVMPLDQGLSEEQLANWIFIVDAINFSFWTPSGQPKYKVTFNNKTRTGYLAMVLAVNRAIKEGKPMYNPNYYSKLNIDDLKTIFRSDTSSTLPLFEKRAAIFSEVGNILIDKYEGSFLPILRDADGSAIKLMQTIASEFPCFHDVHSFEGEQVAILKRAQIVVADIWLLYKGERLGAFKDLDQLTMFADYRVPQSLCYFGALSYSQDLMEKLKQEHLFTTGDREEVEIRGASIEAVEQIVDETNKILAGKHKVNSIKVDYFLWDYRIENAKKLDSVPYHKVRCIYY